MASADSQSRIDRGDQIIRAAHGLGGQSRHEGTLEDALRALDEAAELAKSIRIELDDDYLRAIAIAEALPENQSGTDKSWVWRMEHAFRDHYRRARRV